MHHQFVALVDNVAHRGAEVLPYGVHIDVRIGEFQVLEEDTVQVVVIILSGVCQQAVEILPTFVDHGRQADDFRARADDDQKLQPSVILELCHILFNWFKIGIRFIRVENLIAIHHRDEVLGLREIDDIVRVSRQHVHSLDIVARDLEFDHFVGTELAFLDQAMAGDDDEELPLGVVPVLAFGDARLGNVDGHLAGVQRMHKLRETAAVVHVHLQREGYLLFGKIAEVGAVEFLGKAAEF